MRADYPFELRDIELATTFAAQVAVALRFDDARVDAQRLRMFEDRDVVAQDLNDNVMQRLFATGAGLQSLAELPLGPLVAARLSRYIADLDETIEQLRIRVADPARGQFRHPDPRVRPLPTGRSGRRPANRRAADVQPAGQATRTGPLPDVSVHDV